jgi:hypothetical protein
MLAHNVVKCSCQVHRDATKQHSRSTEDVPSQACAKPARSNDADDNDMQSSLSPSSSLSGKVDKDAHHDDEFCDPLGLLGYASDAEDSEAEEDRADNAQAVPATAQFAAAAPKQYASRAARQVDGSCAGFRQEWLQTYIAKWKANSTRGRYLGKWAQDMRPVRADMELEFSIHKQ